MSCYYHKNKDAEYTCCSCGKLICDDCAIEIDGRMYCKACVVDIVKSKKHFNNQNVSSSDQKHRQDIPSGHQGYEMRPSMPPHRHGRRSLPLGFRYYSGLLTCMFSILPGAGYMFLGLMKRGMFFLAAFFLSCYLISIFDSAIAGFTLVIIFIVSFFDTLRVRRLLNSGVYVEDGFDDILGFVKKYFALISAVFLFDILRTVFRTFFGWGGYGSTYYNSIFGIVIIIFGGLIIYNAVLKNKHDKNSDFDSNKKNNDFIDKR